MCSCDVYAENQKTSKWDKWLSLFKFYRKTFLRSVDPKQPKNVKFSLRSIIETFPRWGAKILRGGAKQSHNSPQNPAMMLNKPQKCLHHTQFLIQRTSGMHSALWLLLGQYVV
jgi:hypothetical protein